MLRDVPSGNISSHALNRAFSPPVGHTSPLHTSRDRMKMALNSSAPRIFSSGLSYLAVKPIPYFHRRSR